MDRTGESDGFVHRECRHESLEGTFKVNLFALNYIRRVSIYLQRNEHCTKIAYLVKERCPFTSLSRRFSLVFILCVSETPKIVSFLKITTLD